MKKFAKKILCLVLAILLVGSMAVPSAAVAATGTGNYGQYSYSYTVECADTYGLAQISANGMPAYVKAYVECTLYNPEYKVYSTSRSADNIDKIPSYYVFAVATAGNNFVHHENPLTGQITKVLGRLWVANENVVPGVYDYPG